MEFKVLVIPPPAYNPVVSVFVLIIEPTIVKKLQTTSGEIFDAESNLVKSSEHS